MSTERVRKHRNKLREAGLHPIQLWVPDTRDPAFREACRRQSMALRDDPCERDILDWIEEVSDPKGWE